MCDAVLEVQEDYELISPIEQMAMDVSVPEDWCDATEFVRALETEKRASGKEHRVLEERGWVTNWSYCVFPFDDGLLVMRDRANELSAQVFRDRQAIPLRDVKASVRVELARTMDALQALYEG